MSKSAIRSPLPGTFYSRPTPDSAPFKAEGASVVDSDVIGLIEVMKSFHEVRAGIQGSALKYLVEDGDAVMAGEILAEVE